jgi:hypothetical protein
MDMAVVPREVSHSWSIRSNNETLDNRNQVDHMEHTVEEVDLEVDLVDLEVLVE